MIDQLFTFPEDFKILTKQPYVQTGLTPLDEVLVSHIDPGQIGFRKPSLVIFAVETSYDYESVDFLLSKHIAERSITHDGRDDPVYKDGLISKLQKCLTGKEDFIYIKQPLAETLAIIKAVNEQLSFNDVINRVIEKHREFRTAALQSNVVVVLLMITNNATTICYSRLADYFISFDKTMNSKDRLFIVQKSRTSKIGAVANLSYR